MTDILDDPSCNIGIRDQKQLLSLASSLDQLGYFPQEAFQIISENNHFNLFVPKERGGMNCSLPQGMYVIEAYSRIEGNLGWIVQIGSGGGVFSAYLPEKVSNEFFGSHFQVIAGSDFVGGKAIPDKDGYRVTGKWRYASGSHHATAFTGNCRITSGPEKGKIKAVIVPADQVSVVEDWNAMGMRATDSHSFRMDNVFVPGKHTFIVAQDHLFVENRLLNLPFLLFARALFTPVLIGVAHHYLTLYRNYMLRRNFKENSPAGIAFMHLEQVWGAGRKDLYQFTEDVWKAAETLPVSQEYEDEYAKTCVRIADDLIGAIDLCHRHTGMEGISMNMPINVAYRNIKTAASHYLLSPSSLIL